MRLILVERYFLQSRMRPELHRTVIFFASGVLPSDKKTLPLNRQQQLGVKTDKSSVVGQACTQTGGMSGTMAQQSSSGVKGNSFVVSTHALTPQGVVTHSKDGLLTFTCTLEVGSLPLRLPLSPSS